MLNMDRALSIIAITLILSLVCVFGMYQNGYLPLLGNVDTAPPISQVVSIDGIPAAKTWDNVHGRVDFYGITIDGKIWACRRDKPECYLLWIDRHLRDAYEKPQELGSEPDAP